MSIRNGLIFLILMLSAVHGSLAKEASKTFLVGVENLDYYPILRFDGQTPEGFLMALLDEVTKESDISYELLPFPVARLKKELAVGNIDVQFPDNPSWNYDFQQPKVFSRPVVIPVPLYICPLSAASGALVRGVRMKEYWWSCELRTTKK